MASAYHHKSVTSELALYLDAANRDSHPGSGVFWYDLVKRNTSSYQNGPTFSTDFGGCMNFVGLNTYVYTYSDASYAFGTGDFAIETWVWMNSISSVTPFLQSDPVASSTSDKWWLAHVSGTGLYFSKHAGGGAVSIPWVPETNTWYHLLVTRNSSVYTLYVNGETRATQGTITNATMGQNGISIGGMSTPYWLNGKISVVKLYSGRGLNQREVTQNFNVLRRRYEV
jgi:hypothetical protein